MAKFNVCDYELETFALTLKDDDGTLFTIHVTSPSVEAMNAYSGAMRSDVTQEEALKAISDVLSINKENVTITPQMLVNMNVRAFSALTTAYTDWLLSVKKN